MCTETFAFQTTRSHSLPKGCSQLWIASTILWTSLHLSEFIQILRELNKDEDCNSPLPKEKEVEWTWWKQLLEGLERLQTQVVMPGNTDTSAHLSSSESKTPYRCTYRFKKNYVSDTVAVSYSGSTPKFIRMCHLGHICIPAERRGEDFDCVLFLDPYFHFVSICGYHGAIRNEETFCSLEVLWIDNAK